jgi:hypothetical protein
MSASNLCGYIDVALSNGAFFANANDGDVVVFTDCNIQSICIGTTQNSNAIIKVSSSNVVINGNIVMPSQALPTLSCAGLKVIMASAEVVAVTNVSTWSSSLFSFELSNTQAGFVFNNPLGSNILMLGSNGQLSANIQDSVTRPSYTWGGDNATGVYHAMNGVIGIGTSGSNAATMSNGHVIVTGNMSADNMVSFRNKIHNGDFRVNQRNFSSLSSSANTMTHITDRFYIWMNPSSGTFTYTLTTLTSSDTPFAYGFRNSMRCAATAALTTPNNMWPFQQIIEAFDMNDLGWGSAQGHPVTVSFWFKTNVTGTHWFSIRNYLVWDFSYTGTFNVASANTYQYVSLIVPAPPAGVNFKTNTNQGSLEITIDGIKSDVGFPTANQWTNNGYAVTPSGYTNWINGTGNYIEFTGLQLERGTCATPFEVRPLSVEQRLCQRFYYRRYNETTNERLGFWCTDGDATYGFTQIQLPVKMRAPPVASVSQVSHFWFGSGNTATSMTNDAGNTTSEVGVLRIGGVTGTAANTVYQIASNGFAPGTVWLEFDANIA